MQDAKREAYEYFVARDSADFSYLHKQRPAWQARVERICSGGGADRVLFALHSFVLLALHTWQRHPRQLK